jgi:two-component system response regulator AtoC
MDSLNNTEKNSILMVNIDSQTRNTVSKALDRGNDLTTVVDSTDEALTVLRQTSVHLVVVGNADATAGRESVARIKAAYPWLEIIAIVGDDNDAGDMIRSGAVDCLTGAGSSEEIVLRIRRALEHGRLRQELSHLRQQVAMSYGFDNIVGISKPVMKLKETIRRIAATDISIFIHGPSGSGKELLAKVIHHHSLRRKGNFIPVDCSSIPEILFESQLFGEEKTATDIDRGSPPCLLMQAHNGTIFFDDVDRLPPAVQPRLMTFLKNFSIPATGHSEVARIDVRVISASSRNLQTLVEEGCFSRELYYQLSVLPLTVPGLAQRPEDIEMLAEYFLRRLAHEMDRPQFEVTRRALDLLAGHTWPGNVRELENTLKRATALCRNNCIDADDILLIGTDTEMVPAGEPGETTELTRRSGLLDEGQRSIIIKALSENNWNFTQTAQELGIGRTTLWRKVKKYNLKKEEVAL